MILPKGHKYFELRDENGFATNADYVDQKASTLRQMRGLRNNVPGLIAQRDFGTELLFKAIPVEDPRTIITIANNGSGLVRVTVTAHGYSTGNAVYVYGVLGTTEANGVWVITVISADTFDLVASVFVNAYTSGGIVGKKPIGNKLITGVANNGSGLIRVTVPIHGYATGNRVFVSGVEGTTEANGNWATITKIDANTFDLVGSAFINTWTGNGIVMVEGKGIYSGTTLNDPTTRTVHEILVGIASDDKTRVFIDNSTDKSGTWEEITRTVAMKVNDTAGAADFNVDVDTITERGATIVPKTDELKGWIAVNTTRGVGETAQVPTAVAVDGGTGLITITIAGHGYATGDILYCYHMDGLLYSNGYWVIILYPGDETNRFILVGSNALGQPAWTSGTGFFVRKPSVVLITANTATNITSNATLGSNGQNWLNNDDITLYRTTAGYYGIDEVLGVTPHFRFNGVDDQRKANVYYGASRQALESPYNIQRSDARNFFGTAAPAFQLALPQSLYAERGGAGLSFSYRACGTANSRMAISTKGTLGIWETDESDPWATISFTGTNPGGAATPNLNVRFTVLYGYQESDPVGDMFWLASGLLIAATLTFRVNPAKMPKNATGIRIYRAEIDLAAPDIVQYRQDRDVIFDKLYPGTGPLFIDVAIFGLSVAEPGAGIFNCAVVVTNSGAFSVDPRGIIDDNLGHAPDLERAAITPKFAVRASRSQGGIMAVNENDNTVRLSSYSQDTHMDDIYTEQITDINGNKQKVFLGSRGELLGMAFAGVTSQLTGLATGVIFFFKPSEIEFFDFQENKQGVVGADFLAVDSLCGTPYGIVFGGNSGIWFIPTGKVFPNEIPINEAWRNLYDGTLKTDDGTASRVTPAARQALKIGYNPYFNEIWCRLEVRKADNTANEIVSFRYSLTKSRWIGERKLATFTNGEIRYFSQRTDGTMTLGCPHGLLKYPRLV